MIESGLWNWFLTAIWVLVLYPSNAISSVHPDECMSRENRDSETLNTSVVLASCFVRKHSLSCVAFWKTASAVRTVTFQ